jgi:GH35 family endo-1,4-beta-xylanase
MSNLPLNFFLRVTFGNGDRDRSLTLQKKGDASPMTNSKDSRSLSRRSITRRTLGALVCLGPIAVSACSSGDSNPGEDVAAAQEGVVAADCGFSVNAHVYGVGKKGFHAIITVVDTNGAFPKDFSLLVNAGAAKLVRVEHGRFKASDYGYLLTPKDAHQCRHERRRHTYTFELKFEGKYTQLTTNVMSVKGTSCDQAAPDVALTASNDFFTSDGKLTLTAEANDNVAVGKVVFMQDDVAIGVDTTAPYTLDVPVSNALNGRHRYTATAYDLTGNASSESTRVLVAINNKFFGTAASNSADYTSLLTYFNQLTPGNAGKWGSVEAVKDQMNFTDLDTAYKFAKDNHIKFKLHTLVWGQQQPAWLDTLTPEQQLEEIDQWMSALAERYPDVDLIDVVNEPLHAPPSYIAALGGAGTTGWDWVVTAFEMARKHFPNAELILNDYSIFTLGATTQSYVNLIKILDDQGLIDGIGEQGHFYERAPEIAVLKDNLNALAATGLPIYISELDLNFADDARQANRMKDVFSTFWSNPSVLGVTHWGYLQGNMWQTDAYLVKTDGTVRPALTYIQCVRAGGTDCPVPVIIPQPRKGDNTSITLEAEEYDNAHALLPAGKMVAYASDGAWFEFDQVAFSQNWDTLTVAYALGGANPISLSVHLDGLDNAPVATVPLAPTGDWTTMKTVSIPWLPIGTQQNVYVRFNGGGANVDSVKFSAPSGTGANILTQGDFEGGTTDGWSTWGAGTIANTTTRALTGTHSLAMTGRSANAPLSKWLTNSVSPGKTYKVSLWTTIGGAAASDTAHVTTAIQCNGGATSYQWLGNTQKTITNGSWVELAGDVVIPDCQLANFTMFLEGPGENVDVYIDHVSLRQVTSSNIIANGTFESGTSGWYSWNGGAATQASDRFHGGSKSLKISPRTSDAPAATSLMGLVKAGTNYPLNLWVSLAYTDGTTAAKSLHVTQAATCQETGTSYNWIGGPVNVSDGATWTQIAGTVAVPNCTLTAIQIFVEGAAGADLYVDDVQVLDNSVSSNLINDGTFESGQGAWGGWGFAGLGVTSTSKHGGNQSLLGSSLSSGAAISRDIKALVAAGKKYQATAWVSVANRAAGSGLVKWQTVQNCNSDASDSYPWLNGTTVANGAWAQVSGVVDLSACTSVNKLVLFAGADEGDLYLDDVVLAPLP